MRIRKSFILHLLADPEEPEALRGLIHAVASGEEQPFAGGPALLVLLRRMVNAALDCTPALDAGQEVRGVRAYGQPLHLLSLVQHGSGRVLTQVAIEAKRNEITAAPQLLAGRELRSTVTTMDAMHTQMNFAQQILDQHGHYLMVVKKNQPELYNAIALLFEQPPWLPR